MTEQMQDHFERLDDVDGMLERLDGIPLKHLRHCKLFNARKELQKTTAQLRADYGKMARARDAAVELLAIVRQGIQIKILEYRCPTLQWQPVMFQSWADRITQTIALLQGGGDDVE